MNDIIKRNESTELSADFLTNLASGLAQSVAAVPTSGGGGKPILRLLKSGIWVFGQADDQVQAGSEWAVNPASITHGWICWSNDPSASKNQLLGEVMVPANQPYPVKPQPINGYEFKPQRCMDMRCVSGEDEGVEVIYKGASDGAQQACANFFAQLGRRYAGHSRENPCPYPVPVIQLGVSDYKHPKHGQIFKPILEIVDWSTMHGDRESDSDPVTPESQPTPPPQAAAAKVKPPLTGAPRRQRPVERA